jgi:hypothetical protein
MTVIIEPAVAPTSDIQINLNLILADPAALKIAESTLLHARESSPRRGKSTPKAVAVGARWTTTWPCLTPSEDSD